jgi:hypothetical protein
MVDQQIVEYFVLRTYEPVEHLAITHKLPVSQLNLWEAFPRVFRIAYIGIGFKKIPVAFMSWPTCRKVLTIML